MPITDKRLNKIESVASSRQWDLTVILENVYDTHNIGAVIRTCDSVGIKEVYVLHNNPDLVKEYLIIGKNSSSGARKWVDVHYFDDTQKCFDAVRSKYNKIYGTHLNEEAIDLYELNLNDSVALVFGNEHAGISEETLSHLDGNFIIPQVGMVQSLNISVACAVSLYEAFRQRFQSGKYEGLKEGERYQALKEEYIKRHSDKFRGRAHEKN